MTDSYNVKEGDTWYNGSSNTWGSFFGAAHTVYNFNIFAHNITGTGADSILPLLYNYTYPN